MITVACHEDLTASDLVGRYLLDASGTRWIDGPLTRAVKSGGICYLDEVVEARKDTTVIIHPLTDHRRTLSIDKLGQVIQADDGFLLVVSYNPGYQNAVKDLKHSTRQRFVAIEFDFPEVERETKIIAHEAEIDEGISNQILIKITYEQALNFAKSSINLSSKGRPVCKLCHRPMNQNDISSENPLVCINCLLYTSPSPRDGLLSRMPSSA